MIKYLVKLTYTATESNPNFAGQVQTWFCGKENHSMQGDEPQRYFVDFYGYSRRQDALRNFHVRDNDTFDDKFWTRETEIVEAVC